MFPTNGNEASKNRAKFKIDCYLPEIARDVFSDRQMERKKIYKASFLHMLLAVINALPTPYSDKLKDTMNLE